MRHSSCHRLFSVIARSKATKQSRFLFSFSPCEALFLSSWADFAKDLVFIINSCERPKQAEATCQRRGGRQSQPSNRHCERSEAIAFMVLVLFFFFFGVVLKGVLPPLRIKKGGFALVLIRVVSKGSSYPFEESRLPWSLCSPAITNIYFDSYQSKKRRISKWFLSGEIPFAQLNQSCVHFL